MLIPSSQLRDWSWWCSGDLMWWQELKPDWLCKPSTYLLYYLSSHYVNLNMFFTKKYQNFLLRCIYTTFPTIWASRFTCFIWYQREVGENKYCKTCLLSVLMISSEENLLFIHSLLKEFGLTPDSGNILGGAWQIIMGARNQTWVAHTQSKLPVHCTISLTPWRASFNSGRGMTLRSFSASLCTLP